MRAHPSQLESILSQWESDPALLEADNFARRLAIQDDLDRVFPDAALHPDSTQHLIGRVRALHQKFESINSHLFASIRRQIQLGTCPAEFAAILHTLATPPRGLAYDYLDDLVAGVLQFDPPAKEPRALSSDSVFYQPTPARHIFHLITAASITHADTLIDLGSGLGHIPLLVSLCTGATSIGVERDPTWIASASKCADTLNLRNLTFVAQDARHADLSRGTVFYLYTPFTGATLEAVLDSLRTQSTLRPLRICTFGPCTHNFAQQPWLHASSVPDPEQITIFRSTS